MSDATNADLPEDWLQRSGEEARITADCWAKADAEAKRLIALLDKRVEQAGSDTTNERPGEAGLYYYDGHPVMVTIMDGKPVIHFPLGGGFAANYMPTGTFEKAVPASELATLQADCERWSGLYAKQADELLAAKQSIFELRRLYDDARDHVQLLQNRVNQLEAQVIADILARDVEPANDDLSS